MSVVDTTYIKEVFEDMMDYIRDIYDTDDPKEKPYFMYGRKHEILQLLNEKDKADDYKYKKYPLIILYHSQPETFGSGIPTNYLTSPLVSIVTDSEKTWSTETRYQTNIKDILFVLRDLLITEIAANPAFYQSYSEEIVFNQVVWDGNPSENKNTGVIFNDYLDGIDLKFSDLRLFRNQGSGECETVMYANQ